MLLAIHVLTEIMTRTCALQPPARENLGRLRTGEVIPLCFVATQCQQVFRLRCLFHTFGQGLEAEALRHGNDGGHNGEIVAIGQHVPHERDVDLQFMNGKSLEVSQ